MTYEGFHGTNLANGSSILKSNFIVSCKEDEWLGEGAYFFLHGVGDPQEHAKNWSILQSYDKKARAHTYHEYAVLRAEITIENVMHLDTDEGIAAFNFFRQQLIELITEKNWNVSKRALENDCYACNFAMNHGGYEAIVNREYIKLDKWSRIKRYQSRLPTCKIMCVKDPHKSIDIRSLAIVEQGSCI